MIDALGMLTVALTFGGVFTLAYIIGDGGWK